MATWIWERADWPKFRGNSAALATPVAEAAELIGHLRGRIGTLNEHAQDQAGLAALTADVLQSSAIEGETLDPEAVRSSLRRRLGLPGDTDKMDRNVEGVVAMMLDATQNADLPLTAARLKGWQAALFPTGYSGSKPVRVGAWRDAAGDPMQVISGRSHRPKVHYEAPAGAHMDREMGRFLKWFESRSELHPLVKAGLAHLWFVSIHPFEDGNGRVARAISDLVLSRSDRGYPYRFYSHSAQLLAEQKDYYNMLERTQRGGTDVTPWLQWFANSVGRSVLRAEHELERVLTKALFWQRVGGVALSERQVKALNKVLDEFDQPVTNRNWAALTKASSDTALRDANSLIKAGVMERLDGGGRSACYWLVGVPRPAVQLDQESRPKRLCNRATRSAG